MDHLLAEQGIDPATILGYDGPTEDSHVAVAAAVASGVGDVGPGIEAAAQQFGLHFIPLIAEDYYLVCLKDALAHPAVLKLRAALDNPVWPQVLAALPGYEPARSGEVLSLTQALPWWHFRVAKKEAAE
jgi:putative molybdopterin biosynthesis protein